MQLKLCQISMALSVFDFQCSPLLSGNLYFTNVDLEDANSGRAYICLVYNNELRSLVQGDDQKIEPRPIVGMKNDLQLLGGASKRL